MRILFINSVCGIRSTGRICLDLAKEYEKKGYEVKIAYGREVVPYEAKKFAIRIGNNFTVRVNALLARLFDNEGRNAYFTTKKFLKWVESYNPDVIWLHNIHGYYINYELLFDWIKKHNDIIIKWTLHDCWAFTGHCSYFSYVRCDKWVEGCKNCIQKNEYPKACFRDNSQKNYFKKRKAFGYVKNMTVITPSNWLSELVEKSFLGVYKREVIHNTIDKTLFKNIESDFKKNNGIEGKKMVLGVSSSWSFKKGLGDFIKLSKLLDESFVIVLVGLTKQDMLELPSNVIGIEKTNDTKELAEIYSAADVFVNPTYEDNYPTVNLEAIACGTPVITYNTGGSPESAEEYGVVVPQGDLEAVRDMIKKADSIRRKTELQ